jgi:hypothetical protein
MSTEVTVTQLPTCDICKADGMQVDAEYDAKTVFGPWANMCRRCYVTYGPGRLGTGYGQRLVLRVTA